LFESVKSFTGGTPCHFAAVLLKLFKIRAGVHMVKSDQMQMPTDKAI